MHHLLLFFFVSMFFKILIDIYSCTWLCFHFLQKVLKIKDHFSIFSKHKTWIWGIQKENIKFGSLCTLTKFRCIISLSFFFVSMFFKILIDIYSCTWLCFHFLQKVLKIKDHFSIFSKHKTWIWGIQKENIKFGSLCTMTKFGCIMSSSSFFLSQCLHNFQWWREEFSFWIPQIHVLCFENIEIWSITLSTF